MPADSTNHLALSMGAPNRGTAYAGWRGDARAGGQAGSILCVASALDDQAELLDLVRQTGQAAVAAATMEEVLASLQARRHGFCLLLLDGTRAPLRIARAIRGQHPTTAIIAVVDASGTDQLTEALRAGVFDVALRPLAARDLEALLSNAHQQAALASTGALPPVDVTPWGVFGTSPAMREVMALARLAGTKPCGVLVCGERGTGHEMVARAIHAYGPHPEAAFVAFDCANRSASELEQDLFGGGRRGKGTPGNGRRGTAGNGRRDKPGTGQGAAVARASGGTLFLDHITDLPRPLQARLRRVLEDGDAKDARDRSEPAEHGNGEGRSIRVVAGADVHLAGAEEAGLDADLYDRLAVIQIELPPLRQRREDIPALAAHFLKEICRAEGQPPKTLTRGALTLLGALAWRGNARELRSLLERLVVLIPQGIIRLEDVLAHTRVDTSIVPLGARATLREARARFERDYIAAVVRQHHGRMTEAAEALGIQRTNLYRKMRRLRLGGMRH